MAAALAPTLLAAAFLLAPGSAAEPADLAAPPTKLRPRPAPRTPSRPTIDFSELYTFGPRALEPTPRLRALQGQRVTLVGFMVELALPARGGFFLAPYPATSDESGAGRGGLPPTSVLVLVPSARGRTVTFIAGPLEVTGTLDAGNRASPDGEMSSVRLHLDDLRDLKVARPGPKRPGAHPPKETRTP
jgi:hypothetical protein